MIDHFIVFNHDRVASIRLSREFILAEGRAFAMTKGARRKPGKTKSDASTRRSRLKPVMLTKESTEAMTQLDPATQAMFKELMK